MLTRALAALALTCALAACAHRDGGAAANATSPPRAAYDAGLRTKQVQLAELDHANAERRRAEVARVVTASARDVTPPSSTVERFVVHATNHGARALRRIDGGVIVYGAGLHRLGLATFSTTVDVPPGRAADVPVAIPLAAFAAEGAGALARASGKPKRVELELTGYAVQSGSASGETD